MPSLYMHTSYTHIHTNIILYIILIYIFIRLTWLKKRCRTIDLHRRGPNVTYHPVSVVQHAIEVHIYFLIQTTNNVIVLQCSQKELKGYNKNIGYRQMWHILKDKHHLVVKRLLLQVWKSLFLFNFLLLVEVLFKC